MTHRDTFLAAVLAGARAVLAAIADLDVILIEHLARAHAAWPDLRLDDGAFLAHLGRRLPDDTGEAELRAVRASDVYLACACAGGDPRAIELFERTYLGEVDVAAGRIRAGDSLAVEVKQILRRILFVAEGARPAATADFTGRGDLRGWVRVAATRELLRLVARDRREVRIPDEDLLEALAPAGDPELEYLRDLYRDACSDAFRAALRTLSRRARSLLRYQLLEGLSIDEIGALHGVHRATAARWIAMVRADLLARARTEIGRRLSIDLDEVDSILRLVRSQLDVSVERALRVDTE